MRALGNVRIASLLGVLLSILLASQTAAASWSSAFRLRLGANADGVAALGGANAAVLYTDPDDLYVRRRVSDDGGTGVWAGARLIATDVRWSLEGEPQIAGEGSNVDVVYVDRFRRMVYMRSTDGGYTFPDRMRFGTKGGCIIDPLVDRYGSFVVIAWSTFCEPYGTRVKVSLDGGETFGTTRLLALGNHGLAVTKSTIYVTGHSGGGLIMRRSFDWGATWTRPRLLTTNAHTWYSQRGGGNLSVDGAKVYVTWVALTAPSDGEIPWVRYIHSLDGGASWGPVRDLDLASRKTGGSYFPIVNVVGKAAHFIWARCDDGDCFGNDSVRYAQHSLEGLSSMELVAGGGIPGGVGMAERTLVVYSGGCSGSGACVKARTP
jgi:hypothetical protein